MDSGLKIAVVGLGFGNAFVPIYEKHPSVSGVAICDPDAGRLDATGGRFGIADRYSSLEEVLADDSIGAVHLLTPVPLHVEQTVAVLEAGKHCACAVPMATDLNGLRRIVDARDRSGKVYMMMETGAYSRELFYVKELYERGELGKITFLRGVFYMDLEGGFPLYWHAQPPMHYATHASAPIFALTGARASRVVCLGSGRLRPDLQQPDGNTFPLQTAIFQFEGEEYVAEVTRSWFQVARSFVEAFSVYGERRGFEWQQLEDEDPVLFDLEPQPAHRRQASAARVQIPFRPDLLPPEIAEFADSDHGGSHPHLVHEFISSIVEGRPSAIDAVTAAEWTAPGICANDSALANGAAVEIPRFRRQA